MSTSILLSTIVLNDIYAIALQTVFVYGVSARVVPIACNSPIILSDYCMITTQHSLASITAKTIITLTLLIPYSFNFVPEAWLHCYMV